METLILYLFSVLLPFVASSCPLGFVLEAHPVMPSITSTNPPKVASKSPTRRIISSSSPVPVTTSATSRTTINPLLLGLCLFYLDLLPSYCGSVHLSDRRFGLLFVVVGAEGKAVAGVVHVDQPPKLTELCLNIRVGEESTPVKDKQLTTLFIIFSHFLQTPSLKNGNSLKKCYQA